MIRGVLVEKKRNYAIVLTPQGEFVKTEPVFDLEIGQEATVAPVEEGRSSSSVWRKISSSMALRVSTVLALILILIIPFYGWFGPSNDTYAYVSIDINPSIELAVNESYQVVDAIGLNEDGETVLSDLAWQEQSVIDLSQSIIEKSDQLGYIQENHQVLIGISYLDETKNSEVLDQISENIHDYRDTMEVALLEIPEHVRKQAQEFHQSMNLTYATEQLSKMYEEEESEEAGVREEQSTQKESNERQTDNDRQLEALKRFIEHSNRENLPPGLLKKLREDGKLPRGLQKKIDGQDDAGNEADDQRNHKGDGTDQSDGHPSNKGEDHPSNQKGNKPLKEDGEHPSNKDGEHPSNKGEDHPSNKDEDHPSNKGEGHPANKDERHPSQKGDDHPSNKDGDHPSNKSDGNPSDQQGHGPPTENDDHPSNQSGDHPRDEKADKHPSDKDEDHPSNNQGPPSP